MLLDILFPVNKPAYKKLETMINEERISMRGGGTSEVA
jgi:hypothetical protein